MTDRTRRTFLKQSAAAIPAALGLPVAAAAMPAVPQAQEERPTLRMVCPWSDRYRVANAMLGLPARPPWHIMSHVATEVSIGPLYVASGIEMAVVTVRYAKQEHADSIRAKLVRDGW